MGQFGAGTDLWPAEGAFRGVEVEADGAYGGGDIVGVEFEAAVV
jgi:hypothetical protein